MVNNYSLTTKRFMYMNAYSLPRIDELINEIAKPKYYRTVNLKSTYYQVRFAAEEQTLIVFKDNFINTVACFSR